MQEELFMLRVHQADESTKPPAFLHTKHRVTKRRTEAAGWRINGYAAQLLIWSPEEWEKLEVRPMDAQFHPFGFWCALRIE